MIRLKNSTCRGGAGLVLRVLCLGSLSLITVCATLPAPAQTLTTLHSFTGQMDGASPQGLVAVDRAGNVYGSAQYGGSHFGGTVFRASNRNGAWTFTPLYSFQRAQDGSDPWAGVTLGPDGALYGTTLYGGGNGCTENMGCGTVFRLTPPPTFCRMVLCPWDETVIYHTVNPSDPNTFFGGVILDSAGDIYGMSQAGGNGTCFGNGCGTVYKLTPSGGSYTLNVIYNFQGGNDGAAPLSNELTMDAAGNLYGAATYGGQFGYGTVFKLVHSAGGYTFQLLYTFTNGADGTSPQGSVVLDSAGNLYGSSGDGGGIFQITPSGTFTVIDTQAASLQSPISIDAAGNIYGTTYALGSHDDGSVFKLSYSNGVWTHTILHSFNGLDGALPLSGVGFDASGNLYGTATIGGGPAGDGTLWQLTP